MAPWCILQKEGRTDTFFISSTTNKKRGYVFRTTLNTSRNVLKASSCNVICYKQPVEYRVREYSQVGFVAVKFVWTCCIYTVIKLLQVFDYWKNCGQYWAYEYLEF